MHVKASLKAIASAMAFPLSAPVPQRHKLKYLSALFFDSISAMAIIPEMSFFSPVKGLLSRLTNRTTLFEVSASPKDLHVFGPNLLLPSSIFIRVLLLRRARHRYAPAKSDRPRLLTSRHKIDESVSSALARDLAEMLFTSIRLCGGAIPSSVRSNQDFILLSLPISSRSSRTSVSMRSLRLCSAALLASASRASLFSLRFASTYSSCSSSNFSCSTLASSAKKPRACRPLFSSSCTSSLSVRALASSLWTRGSSSSRSSSPANGWSEEDTDVSSRRSSNNENRASSGGAVSVVIMDSQDHVGPDSDPLLVHRVMRR
mmetsp:Transcript_26149/g.48715  ORF Transcript_26149/g.48715 Transcript_26149/m.48715 type:complete len:317 (-) Transcript_26149:141-1091(-)